MELLSSIFIIGSIPFWSAIVFLLACFTIGLYRENIFSTVFVVVAVLAGGALLKHADIMGFLHENWGHLAFYVVTYFVIGGVWSVIKFWLYATKLRDIYDEAKQDFLSKTGVAFANMSQDQKQAFIHATQARLKEHMHYQRNYPLHVAEHKAYITLSIMYWPVSAVWTVINDPLQRLVQYIYRHFRAVYQRISDKTSAGYREDMAFLKADKE